MTVGDSKAATTITQTALVSSPQPRPAPTRRALPPSHAVQRGQNWKPIRGPIWAPIDRLGASLKRVRPKNGRTSVYNRARNLRDSVFCILLATLSSGGSRMLGVWRSYSRLTRRRLFAFISRGSSRRPPTHSAGILGVGLEGRGDCQFVAVCNREMPSLLCVLPGWVPGNIHMDYDSIGTLQLISPGVCHHSPDRELSGSLTFRALSHKIAANLSGVIIK
jgi:hypothetical protein